MAIWVFEKSAPSSFAAPEAVDAVASHKSAAGEMPPPTPIRTRTFE
jgi:hypothetical protein